MRSVVRRLARTLNVPSTLKNVDISILTSKDALSSARTTLPFVLPLQKIWTGSQLSSLTHLSTSLNGREGAHRVIHVLRATSSGSSVGWAQHQHVRAASSGPTPRFTGGKLKPYSSFKRRFKLTATGLIKYFRCGHVHKRFNKKDRQLRVLGSSKIMHPTYARTMKRLGFTMRRF